MDLELSVLQRPSDGLGYIAGFAITDQLLFAVGGTSSRCPTVVASSNARHFEPRKTPRYLGLRDVVAVDDALWVCGEYGQLAVSRDQGVTWKVIDTGTDWCLFALALALDGAVWVVGDHGYAARVMGEKLERIDMQTSTRLAAIYAHRDELVMLGFDGALYRRRGDEVVRIATGATTPLTALAITKLGTWIVVGDGGFIARSPDGAWWSRVKSGVDVDLEAIGSCADGTLVIAGDVGSILLSIDDGRTWHPLASQLSGHLWSVERFGSGVLIGGDGGSIAKLAPPGDDTWHDRINVFGTVRPLDVVFAEGPDGFVAHRLTEYLGTPSGRDPLKRCVSTHQFEHVYGVPMPPEAVAFFAAVEGHDRGAAFAELRPSSDLVPDAGDQNLFERLVRSDQQAPLGTGIAEAFCGVFCIGSQDNGDTYHMELYEWDGPRQVLHYNHVTHAFTGVIADSLDSLVYLAALERAHGAGRISQEAFAIGLRKLRGKVAPTSHFAIEDDDPDFEAFDPKRRDSELFFYRSRWICALLANDGVTTVADIPRLFNADFNQVVPQDQLPARYEACEKVIPTALYSMWRAYLFDEPELVRYLEIGRRHPARLVRDAAALIDELRAGRNELGTIVDVRAHLAAFRALDLDPRRADQRRAEAEAKLRRDATRRDDVVAELERAPSAAWSDLAWRWLGDGIAHRALLAKLVTTPELAAQIAALDELRDAPDCERDVMLPRLAGELAPELEALLVGSLVRDDNLDGMLARDRQRGATVADDEAEYGDENEDDEDADDGEDADDAEDDEDDDTPPPDRVRAALALTERALRLAPGDEDTQFTHAMLLLDADRAGLPGKLDELLRALPGYAAANRINIAVRMGKQRHERFGDVLDAVLADKLPDRLLAEGGSANLASYGDVADEVLGELGELVIEHAPARLARFVPLLPARVMLLSALAWRAIQAERRDDALALYERLLALPIPEAGDERTNYLRAMNNACVQAHGAKAYDTAVRIADRAQPVAHENPYIYHSAACAYAAVGDYVKAFEQVKLAVQHDYDHLGKVEVDADLGQLLEWPEFKALFRDWHDREEGN